MEERLSPPAMNELPPLNEEARFLDLWRSTEPLWRNRSLPERLNVNELIFAARLAHRLGNNRYYRGLMRLAEDREPDNLRVRYYAQRTRDRSASLLDILRELEQHAQADFENADLKASWLSTYAYLLSRVRDFRRAQPA